MPDEINITINGIDEVIGKLNLADTTIVKTAFARAAAAALVPIMEEVKLRTPIDTGRTLHKAMSAIELSADGKGVHAAMGFGNRGYIARMVEYGHRMVGHKPGKKQSVKHPFVAARPFMRPAAEASGEEAINEFAKSMADTLRNEI